MSHRRFAVIGATFLIALAGAAHAKPPREFLKTAIQGDNSEVELGRIAQNRAADPAVKDFGGMLVMDHSMHRDMIRPMAERAGVKDLDGMAPEAREERRKLQGLNGRAFDREFARYMVKDHRKDIHEYEEQAHGHGPLADLARQTLPTLHKHLDTAERLKG